ncbi:ABC transporter permease [Glycomyces albidus]|uniref:ABC transporter permease n=1 Tax=Glycomyces albidus TaxID=2656774 RepID=A0A6L5GAR0_9ACTN|nr:ABC transporter permease [Glycomyces albidus]
MTTTRSAYPAPVEHLVPQARALADELGSIPSRNQLKARLRIGAPKANAVLAELADYVPNPAPADPATATAPHEPAAAPASTGPAEDETRESRPVVDAAPAEVKPEAATLADPVAPAPAAVADTGTTAAEPVAGPAEADPPRTRRRLATWPVLLLMLPATVAIWSGWVGLGQLAGFGPVHPLPGIADSFVIDTSITLPIGMETYSAYALYVWLSGRAGAKAIAFARVSALLALGIGAAGQIAYHLMSAANVPAAHPLITAAVACIPVAVLGLGAALAHLVKEDA